MNWLQFGVQWLHVLLGITWFGYTIAMYFLVSPALAEMPESQLRVTQSRLGDTAARVFPIVGGLVLLLGIIRGTVFGPLDSLDAVLGTTYGITWLVAMVTTIGLFYTGARHIAPAHEGLKDAPDFPAAAAAIRRIMTIDLGLFAIVFTCMILMRFGA